MVLRGLTSGAQARVARVRLVSDNFGDLTGAMWIRDPNATPTPQVRIRSGNRTFKLTSSEIDAEPIPGSTLISSGIARYTATGTTCLLYTSPSPRD